VRHGDKVKKLGRTRAHREAMLRNLVTALFTHQRIRTTLANAKQAARLAERLVSYARQNTLAARRRVAQVLNNKSLVKKLFDEVAPQFDKLDGGKVHRGGYTRIYRLGPRPGDGAEMVLWELVRGSETAKGKETKAAKGRGKKVQTKREGGRKKAAERDESQNA